MCGLQESDGKVFINPARYIDIYIFGILAFLPFGFGKKFGYLYIIRIAVTSFNITHA